MPRRAYGLEELKWRLLGWWDWGIEGCWISRGWDSERRVAPASRHSWVTSWVPVDTLLLGVPSPRLLRCVERRARHPNSGPGLPAPCPAAPTRYLPRGPGTFTYPFLAQVPQLGLTVAPLRMPPAELRDAVATVLTTAEDLGRYEHARQALNQILLELGHD